MSSSEPSSASQPEALPPQRWWRKAAAWVGKQYAEHAIAATWSAIGVVGGAIAIAGKWLGREWACIEGPWCTVSGWSLGLLTLVTLALIAAVAWLLVRVRRLRGRLETASAALAAAKRAAAVEAAIEAAARARLGRTPPDAQAFKYKVVDDERLNLRWQLRRPSSEWLEQDLNRVGSPFVQQVLDGPFHAVEGCQDRLQERGVSSGAPYLEPRCPGCRKLIFRVRELPGESVAFAYTWEVRAQALGELQRMHRNNNTALQKPRIVLERPQYWQRMIPV
jgi:hypothetical protein